MKQYTEPSGSEYLSELMEGVANYETALSKNDLPAIVKLLSKTIKSLKDLASHLRNEKVFVQVNFLADECEKLMNKLKSKSASLKEFSEISEISVAKMRDELWHYEQWASIITNVPN